VATPAAVLAAGGIDTGERLVTGSTTPSSFRA
jgi:hypothetical protein